MSLRFFNSSQSVMEKVYKYYQWTQELSDERTRGWLMVDSPIPTLAYTLIYLSIVTIGPRLMRDRKPYKLTSILVPYNMLMCALNLYIAIELLVASTRLKYSYVCQPVTYVNTQEELRVGLQG
ncbi:hypothetical protein M8J76_015967 [Diaphorina citri]|nr:hypothetical protein M8J76_015967 [Diaphorina citri]